MKSGPSLKADLALAVALYAAVLMAVMPAVSGALPGGIPICSASSPGGTTTLPADGDGTLPPPLGHCTGMWTAVCGPLAVPAIRPAETDLILTASEAASPGAPVAAVTSVARGPPAMAG